MKTLIVSTLVLFLSPAILIAGAVQLPETGQTNCWDSTGALVECGGTGQDGELKVGAAWPPERFTDNGDQTVTDNLTGLAWIKDPSAKGPESCGSLNTPRSWQESLNYVSCLNSTAYLGFKDWRLPNIVELESLVNIQVEFPYSWLNSQGFATVPPVSYWSSSSYVDVPTYAWYVNMVSGATSGYLKTMERYTWPVRGETTESLIVLLPQTGQTDCWDSAGNVIDCQDSGHDGDIRKGSYWPDPRFTTLENQSVIDNLSGLVWSQDAKSPGPTACTTGVPLNWQQAFDHIKCLNNNTYLGYTDWRLPNKIELKSKINAQESDSNLWLSNHGFFNLKDSYYWTSNTYVRTPEKAWSVLIYDGCAVPNNKDAIAYVWPVRGGRESLLTVTLSGSGSGEVIPDTGSLEWSDSIGSGSYTEGTTVTLSATAAEDSTFNGWIGDCSGNSDCQLYLGANTRVMAKFGLSASQHILTVNLLGNGSVHSTPVPDINCTASSCSQGSDIGTLLTMTAVPDPGHRFVGWGGDCIGSTDCQVVMDQTRLVEAIFEALTPLNDEGEFIRQVYRDFLNREADIVGLQYWVDELNSGRRTKAQVVEQYLLSAEFSQMIAPVTRLYTAYFMRIPDYGGLMYWVDRYAQGTTLDDVSDNFAASEEFQQTYGNLSNAEFVTLIYRNVLGREPDAGGLTYWTNELESAARTRGQVMTGFSESAEYQTMMASSVYIIMTYVGLLQRSPDLGGYEYWLEQMSGGTSGLALIDGFLYSQEYEARFSVP